MSVSILMKLYTTKFAPNPRRVEIYLREKGITDIERVVLNLLNGEHRTPEFKQKNPLKLLPVLELEDGRVLTESLAICQYLEELHPDPDLFGSEPWQRAQTTEATRIAEIGLLFGAMTAFQHTQPFFAKTVKQNIDTASEGQLRFTRYLARIDHLLDGRTWLAGELFTLADITAICAIDFGKVAGCVVPHELPNVAAWLARVRARPSCQL